MTFDFDEKVSSPKSRTATQSIAPQNTTLSDEISERQQLEYVGVTRATDTVTVISNNVKKEGSPLHPETAMSKEEQASKATEKDTNNESRNTSPITKIIFGGQTGVDTIGLQVAKKLGIETGGTAPKRFLRERGIDSEDIASYGLTEISDAEQLDYTNRKGKRDPYTGRTELNVRNSDGTVYFATDDDSAGRIATERSAEEWNKPFLLNPTAQQLREWIITNNIRTLNIAGNRGSKLPTNNKIASIIEEALTTKEKATETTKSIITQQVVDHLKSIPGINVLGRSAMEEFLKTHNIAGLQQAIEIDNSNINDSLTDVDKEDILREVKKINRAKRTLIDTGGDFLFLVDHTDRDGLKHLQEGQEGFLCKAKINITGFSREQINEIKNNYEDDRGSNEATKGLEHWIERNGYSERYLNSDSIDAEDRKSATDNAGLDSQAQEGESLRGQSSQNSSEDFGTGQIKTGFDGTNGPRYMSGEGIEAFLTPQGEVYGFVDKEGNIYLDETKISPNHPIHEYTHLWDRTVQKKNPKLWQKGIELMKKTSLWDNILNDKNIFLFVDLNAYASLALWGKGILCLYLVKFTPLGAFCPTEVKKVASLSLQFYSCGFEGYRNTAPTAQMPMAVNLSAANRSRSPILTRFR